MHYRERATISLQSSLMIFLLSCLPILLVLAFIRMHMLNNRVCLVYVFHCSDCFQCHNSQGMPIYIVVIFINHSLLLGIDFTAGNIRFHVAFSNGVSPVGGKYKAASVRTNSTDCSTWLTAKREGHQELLDGESILHDINTLVSIYFHIMVYQQIPFTAEILMFETTMMGMSNIEEYKKLKLLRTSQNL